RARRERRERAGEPGDADRAAAGLPKPAERPGEPGHRGLRPVDPGPVDVHPDLGCPVPGDPVQLHLGSARTRKPQVHIDAAEATLHVRLDAGRILSQAPGVEAGGDLDGERALQPLQILKQVAPETRGVRGDPDVGASDCAPARSRHRGLTPSTHIDYSGGGGSARRPPRLSSATVTTRAFFFSPGRGCGLNLYRFPTCALVFSRWKSI